MSAWNFQVQYACAVVSTQQIILNFYNVSLPGIQDTAFLVALTHLKPFGTITERRYGRSLYCATLPHVC
jgi:hypothetical protein